MAPGDATIRKALPSHDDLKARREHCSVDRRLLGTVGAALGQQVRIRRTATEYALYTVSEPRDEDEADVVRLGLTGRRRLGTDDPFDGAVVLPAADPTMSDRDAETCGELVERLDDNGEHRGLIVIAPMEATSNRTPTSRPNRSRPVSAATGSGRGGARAGRGAAKAVAVGRSSAGT